MTRNKKNGKNNVEENGNGHSFLRLDLAGDVKRSAVAVFLFALGVLTALGFFGQAGVIGEFLNNLAGQTIGWAKVISPLFLLIAGIVLLFRKETSFYVTKLFGLSVALLSVAGFFHWFFKLDEMSATAQAGSGGGYVGYAVAYLAVRYIGNVGGLVVILALLFIGIIVAFNVSLSQLFNKLFGEAEALPEETEENANKSDKPADAKIAAKEDKNIGKIEFVEGPDQYVDEKLLSSISRKAFEVKNNLSEKVFSKKEKSANKTAESDSAWIFPPLDLLEKSSGAAKGGDVEKNAEIIQKTLHNFGIEVEKDEIKTGPSVTQYSFRPAVGVKVSKILSLQNDLSLALAAHPIRIEAPIPGKSLIGIEVPNKVSALVRLRDILENPDFAYRKSNLTLALGEDVSGNYIYANLDKMPHLMIAGATGTGKSVAINTVITTLLYQNSPKDLKFIMVDPKRVELSLYNDIPHLLTNVIVENGKVISALRWAVGEMERRYRLLQDTASRDIASYNEKLKSGQTRKITDAETGEISEEDLEKIPYIIIVIDELADLMGSHGKEVEGAVVRIAQMARAVGIHLIVSTQRPSVEVITGLIKANITTRVAFQVATQIDSRTIIDMAGAEKLLGNGDMLYLSASSPKPKRIQGIFVSESEVKRVVKFIKNQKVEDEGIGENIVNPAQGLPGQERMLEFKDFSESGNGSDDDLYEAAKEEVTRAGKASATLLQRRLRVGYARAARLLDILEDKGIIGPGDGAKPREVYAANPPAGGTPGETIAYDSPIEDQTERDKWQM